MQYDVLVNEIKSVPAEYLDELQHYVELLKYKASYFNQKPSSTNGSNKKIILGLAEGKYKIPEDINTYDDEILKSFGDNL